MEKEMATHSSTLAWKIPWMEKPSRLWSMWSQRVGHDLIAYVQLSQRIFPILLMDSYNPVSQLLSALYSRTNSLREVSAFTMVT